MKKVALYIRVSTDVQDTKTQLSKLVSYSQNNNLVYRVFEEKESTRKTRPVKYQLYQRLLRKEFDGVVVYKLDRWGRSVQEIVREVNALWNKGVKFISLSENIDLSSPEGKLQFHIFSAFAEFERDLISKRTKDSFYVDKDGVTRSRRSNKPIGKRGKDRKVRKKGGYYLRYIK